MWVLTHLEDFADFLAILVLAILVAPGLMTFILTLRDEELLDKDSSQGQNVLPLSHESNPKGGNHG